MPDNHKIQKVLPVIYRPYSFPQSFPVLAFLGENWKLVRRRPDHLHFHNAIEVGRCCSGSGYILVNQQEFHFTAGDYSLIYSDTPHSAYSESEESSWEYLYINPMLFFQPEILTLLQCICGQTDPIIHELTTPFLYLLIKQIFREVHEKPPLYQDSFHGLLLTALSESRNNQVASIKYCPDNYSMIVQRAFSYIRSHYAEPADIPVMAEACNLSESHFRRIFKSVTGVSPLACIHQFRIQTACQMIYNNTESFHNIAASVGYTSLSSFNRQFSKFMHMSPGEWEKTTMAKGVSYEIYSKNDLQRIELSHSHRAAFL